MFLKFCQTNTAGENKITTGEQSSFSPSLSAKFAVSRVKNRCLDMAVISDDIAVKVNIIFRS